MGLADLCGQALNDKEILMSEVWSAMTFSFRATLLYAGPLILLESIYRLWGQLKSPYDARN
jgi:hypothetical protein